MAIIFDSHGTQRVKLIPQQQLLAIVRPSGVLSNAQLLDVIDAQENIGAQPWTINTAAGKNVAANAKEDWAAADNRRYEVRFDLLRPYNINHVSFETHTRFCLFDLFGYGLLFKKPAHEILWVSQDANAWTKVYETRRCEVKGIFLCKIIEEPCIIFPTQPVRYIRLETPFYYKQYNFAMKAMFKSC